MKKKAFDKMQHPLMTKKQQLSKLRRERNVYSLITDTNKKKSTANIILNGETPKAYLSTQGSR